MKNNTIGRLKKISTAILFVALLSVGQPANATHEPGYQDYGTVIKTSSGMSVLLIGSNYRESRFEHEVGFQYNQVNYNKKRTLPTGSFSLHFESGKPMRWEKFHDWRIEPRSERGSNHYWSFKKNRVPVYIQWNPKGKVLKPNQEALRWKVPPFGTNVGY